jgi:transcriptional regulator with GAF, ATPase, and Fis domain
VRELQNVVERAVILAQQGPLRFELERPKEPPAHGPVGRGGLEAFSSPSATILTRAELKARERESLAAALRQTHGKIAGPRGAAALLGMKPTTLTSRLKALGLRWEDLQGPPRR